MEGKFNSKEEFEQVLYKTVKKAGETSLSKFFNWISSGDKDKIKQLYGVKKAGKKIIEILKANPDKYVFISKSNPDLNTWVFRVAENNDTQKIEILEANSDKYVFISKSNSKVKTSKEKNKKAIDKKKVEEFVINEIKNDIQSPKKEKNTLKPKPESDELLLDNTNELISLEENKDVPVLDEELKKIVTKDMVLINDSLNDHTYYISKYLVTQELYERVMGYNPSTFNDSPELNEKQEKRPVETVTYLEAIEFCNRLSEKCGFESCYEKENYIPEINGFRLPTESEWFFVATAENKNSYLYAGSDVPDGFAWYKHNSKIKTHEVGKKNPVMINDSDEVFDMCGNVWEWVIPDLNKDKALCIGGSYEDSEDYLELGKTTNKKLTDKKIKNSTIGFRICVNFLK